MSCDPDDGSKQAGRRASSVEDHSRCGADDRFPEIFNATTGIHKSLLGWRMAVLPFRASGDADAHNVAFGIAEEISAIISRFRSPRLVAPATFWDGMGPADDVLGRCRMYELDYVLDGTIEVNASRVRAKVVLMDVRLNFEVMWDATIWGTADDLFLLEHRIALDAVRQIDPDLVERGPAIELTRETGARAAHTFVLSAIKGIYRLDRRRFTRARGLLTEAIVLDPKYAAAYAWLAYWSIIAVGWNWVDDPRQVTELAGVAADRAIELDPGNARACAIAGHVKAYLQHDVRSALALHARAIELDPNLPIAWAMSSISKAYHGDHRTAIRQSLNARALSPRDPHIHWAEHSATWAHFFDRDLHQAETLSDIVLTRNPDHVSAINVHLAILGHGGQHEEAEHWRARLLELVPSATAGTLSVRAPWQAEDRRYLAEGLRKAGLAP